VDTREHGFGGLAAAEQDPPVMAIADLGESAVALQTIRDHDGARGDGVLDERQQAGRRGVREPAQANPTDGRAAHLRSNGNQGLLAKWPEEAGASTLFSPCRNAAFRVARTLLVFGRMRGAVLHGSTNKKLFTGSRGGNLFGARSASAVSARRFTSRSPPRDRSVRQIRLLAIESVSRKDRCENDSDGSAFRNLRRARPKKEMGRKFNVDSNAMVAIGERPQF
jgi:hypothetical protein